MIDQGRQLSHLPTPVNPSPEKPMPVPLLDVNAQNLPLEPELTAAFSKVLRSGRFILGEEVEAFESECASFIGANHAVSTSSGTDALLAALIALGIGPSDEVLCPSFTFFATAGCIARTGATPVFCDVCPICFNLDVESAASRLTANTRAIVPVHLFGQSADMDSIRSFAAQYQLHLIEDVAQSIGASYKNTNCGTLGDFGCFSFFPSKNLGGFGDGGLVTTNDANTAETLRRIRNHGMHPKYHHHTIGANFRLDALQCALLRIKLPHLPRYAENRARNANYYTSRISEIPGTHIASEADCCCFHTQNDRLKQLGAKLILPTAYAHNTHVWNQFTLRVPGEDRRDSHKNHLTSLGIGCEIYYPIPLHRQPCFATLPPHALLPCPVSETLANEVISIPVYPELNTAQLDEVIAAIQSWLLI